MAFNFTPEHPVLNFGPRHHERWSSRNFLLWPAWAYRVVAPRVRQRQLNVLQRAVMGLCHAGVCRAENLAENLSVHVDLAALILVELTELGHLDVHGLPTEQGLGALENDSLETQEMVTGYVFQDPWTEELWPRFVEQLDYAELEYNETGFPSLLLGSTGKPRRVRAFTVLPQTQVVPATPPAGAIVEAVARHRKGLRFIDAWENNDAESDDEPIGDFVASDVQINRVSFVEEKPQPVFLTTYLYVPESNADAMDWYACDPFGMGQSVRLRRRVETVMREMPELFKIVNMLVGQTLHSGYEEQRRWLEFIQLQAGLEVDRRLTVNIRTHAAFEFLLAMESARQEMRALGQDCPDRKVNEVLRSGVKVLEAVFSSFTASHPLGDIWRRVYVPYVDNRTGNRRLVQQQDRGWLAELYESAMRAVGFLSPVPRALLKVKPSQIRFAADSGDHWRLRPLVTATVLLADRDPTHPLREAARQDSGLLRTVDEIATWGGRAGHASSEPVSITDAEEHVDKVYSVVSTLLGLVGTKSDPSTDSVEEAYE